MPEQTIADAVEQIAKVFDNLAEKAKEADRANRDIDAMLAWQTAARIVRANSPGQS